MNKMGLMYTGNRLSEYKKSIALERSPPWHLLEHGTHTLTHSATHSSAATHPFTATVLLASSLRVTKM